MEDKLVRAVTFRVDTARGSNGVIHTLRKALWSVLDEDQR